MKEFSEFLFLSPWTPLEKSEEILYGFHKTFLDPADYVIPFL